MSRPEPRRGPASPAPAPRYGRYVALLALVVLALITLNTIVTRPKGASGLAPGQQMPPFAVPLALGALPGDADIATRPDQGASGRVPACKLRGPQILNVCQLYEQGPLVLALFVNGGSCAKVLSEMQALAPAFPTVRFAAVAIRGDRGALRRLIRERGVRFPVGLDRDGSLAALYDLATCPQITFALPGGVVQDRALLETPSAPALRARVAELARASTAQGG